MDQLSRHPYLVAGALATVAVLVALFVPVAGSGGDGAGEDRPSAGPTYGPSLGPEEMARIDDEKATDPASSPSAGSGLVSLQSRPSEPSGIPGEGASLDVRYKDVELVVTSSQPIGVVGYQVPTSPDRPSGVAKNVGTSWRLSTIAYGKPDYAQLFLQAGPTGAPITCTIRIDGQVTETRTSRGPYAQLLCQG